MPPFVLPPSSLVNAGLVTGIVMGTLAGWLAWRFTRAVRQTGKAGLYVSTWFAWALGSFVFASAMIGIAGPYAFAGHVRGGGYSSSPMTYTDALKMAPLFGCLGLLYSAAYRAGRRRNQNRDRD